MLAHVEEAEARQAVVDEKLLLDELTFDLAKLDDAHARAIGSQLVRGVFLEADQQFFRGGGMKRGEELFFEHGEGALEGFHVVGFVGAHFGGQFAEAKGGCGAGFRSDGGGVEGGCGGFKMDGDALVLEAGLAGLGGRSC